MGWIYLVLAGLFEIGWPVGLKMAQEPTSRWSGVAVAVSFMTISGAFLWLAQRQIPSGGNVLSRNSFLWRPNLPDAIPWRGADHPGRYHAQVIELSTSSFDSVVTGTPCDTDWIGFWELARSPPPSRYMW